MFKKYFPLIISLICLTSNIQALEFYKSKTKDLTSKTEKVDRPNTHRRIFKTPRHIFSVDLPAKKSKLEFDEGMYFAGVQDPTTNTVIGMSAMQAKSELSHDEVRYLLSKTFPYFDEVSGPKMKDNYFLTMSHNENCIFVTYWYVAHDFLFSIGATLTEANSGANCECFVKVFNSLVFEEL